MPWPLVVDDANVYSQAFAIAGEQPGSALRTFRLAAATKAVLCETLLSGHIGPSGYLMGVRSTFSPHPRGLATTNKERRKTYRLHIIVTVYRHSLLVLVIAQPAQDGGWKGRIWPCISRVPSMSFVVTPRDTSWSLRYFPFQ